MGFGASRRVLLVGGEGIVLYTPLGRGVDRETSIAWDVPNFDQQLTDILAAQNQSKSVLVLFDGADQSYRKEENIPKLSLFDRPGFVKRKLELAFPSYPIRASLEVKPSKARSGLPRADAEPSYLFVALPETEQLDRVGKALLESGVPVGGFGLLPIESEGLVSTLADKAFGKEGKKSRWTVLIGQHETGGLRQVVTKDGGLALTRLTPTSEAGTGGPAWVEEVMREFKGTLTYISRFGYSADDGIDVLIVCSEIEKQFFDQKALAVTNLRCLSVTEALKHIGAKSFGLEKSNFADALHAAWAGRKPTLRLPVNIPSIHRIMAPRLAARLGSAALALGMLAFGGLAFNDYQAYHAVQEELTQKQNRKIALDQEYARESKVFEGLTVKPEIIRAVLSVEKMLMDNTVESTRTLHTLRKALGDDIYLESFSFNHKPASSSGLGGFAATSDSSGEERGRVTLKFKFSLPGDIALEQRVLRAETLERDLRAAFPGYAVRLVTQFGRVSRTGRFTGETGAAGAGAGAVSDSAEFELEGAPL